MKQIFMKKNLAGAENVTQRKKSDRTFIDKLLKRTGRKKVAKIQFNNEGWMWRRVGKVNRIQSPLKLEMKILHTQFGLAWLWCFG